ncbi:MULTISPECIES: amino acid adenylation domain-containing protein [Cyanophyceae]|uniref:Amino acid adenylation domain-containing protein n=1 Tax=Leptolyngbya subtilissima DQ-A4 TaxID=2933933 RepID=A0ABV0K4J3_9CYAN|nr:amino acid adenylation domain-containing protein [Nodosilinea sp. FACHB-141]MBD2112643.1 amino acid adenylation domain-containing protein [Nodosilinea sp. FACHB-141]
MILTGPGSNNQEKSQLNSHPSPVAEALTLRESLHRSNCHNPYDCVHEWFEAQVEATPHAIAVSFLEQSLTYQDLNERANQLAHFLLAQGLQPQELVAISMERCLELIVSIWGVLKAGGAYVPIDPTYPQQRQQYMLQNSQANFLLTQKHLIYGLPDHSARVISVDTDWETAIAPYPRHNLGRPILPEHPAYVIYTSGSTGAPKGVKITHRGVINHSVAITQAFELDSRDRVLQFSSISFDIIVEELFPTLLNGATLVLRTAEISTSIRQFLEFVAARDITILNLPTAFWHELVSGLALLQLSMPPSVRLVVVGGEKASRLSYAEWVRLVGHYPRWLNTYGPTETTVTATLYDPAQSQYHPDQGEIPIGKPIANVEVYVLNPDLEPVPFGEVGELHIGGPGVAIGYHQLPSRTAEKFIPNPFSDDPHSRLYKTGDTVRYLPDGNLEFIGRVDFQVKLRGFRIELGEIETGLEQHPSVRQAIVLAREDVPGDKHLVGYLIAQPNHALNLSDIRTFLCQKLPEYMVPAAFVEMDTFPLSPNGKVDRTNFPAPDTRNQGETKPVVAPSNSTESKLLEIWETILGITNISITDNFFELGGHSLLIARLCQHIEYHFNRSLPPAAIFQAPTVEQLANFLQHDQVPAMSSSMIVIQAGNPATISPLFCIHVLGENGIFLRPLVSYLDPAQPVYGLSAQMLERKNAPPNQIKDLAAFYVQEMRIVQPVGPYFIAGVSFGGEIVFEIAQQLVRQGETVGLLALLDTFGPEDISAKLGRASSHFANLFDQGLPYLLNKVKRRWNDIWPSLLYRYNKLSLKLGQNLSYEQQFLMVLEENKAASKKYIYETYPGKLTLFRATEEIYYSQAYLDEGLGWRDFAGGGLEVHDVPGDHVNMLHEPHVQVLAQEFANCLSKAQASQHIS